MESSDEFVVICDLFEDGKVQIHIQNMLKHLSSKESVVKKKKTYLMLLINGRRELSFYIV